MQGCLLSALFSKIVKVSKFPLIPSGHGKLRVLSTFEHLALAARMPCCIFFAQLLIILPWDFYRDTCTKGLDNSFFCVHRKVRWRFIVQFLACRMLLKIVERWFLPSPSGHWFWRSILSSNSLRKLSPLLVCAVLHQGLHLL